MLRLFVGIAVPPEQKLTLSVLAAGLHGVRWVDPGNFHVTLRFIGEVDEGLADDIDEALAAIRFPRFSLAIAGTGIFGPPEKPRLLYAGLDKEDRLVRLHERVESALSRLGLPAEGRRYVPHVTLAHCHAPHAAEIQDYICRNNLMRLPAFPVDRFHLVRSYLTKAGSIYEDVADYPLQ
jgi:2'-5' RNA ligase